MKFILLPVLLALAGCATLSSPGSASDSVRLLVRQSEAGLRELIADLADPASTPPFASVRSGIDQARIAVAAESIMAMEDGLADQAGLAALGVTLKLCSDGLERMETRDRSAALKLARSEFAVSCLMPLAMLGV